MGMSIIMTLLSANR